MQTTPNLGLKKYETNDTADLTAIGPNWDTLDQEVVKRIVNAGGTPSIQAGPDASKPAPGTAGRLYVATDTQIIYRDTGSAWQKVGVVKWDDIEGKPSSFTPSAHKTTHAIGGSDALSPGDIGAETPAGAQAKAEAAAGAVQAELDAHKADGASHSKTARFVVGTSTAGWTFEDCDYLCDGTNDQEEINNAINALPATGGEVIILDGTYNITAKINVTKDNVSIRGNGNATILKRMFELYAKEGMITLTSRSGCKIANLQVDGNKANYVGFRNSGIYLRDSSNNTVTNNTFNNNDYGIYLDQSSNNTITGNICNSNDTDGIYLYQSSNNTITGNICNNNNNSGIHLDSSSDNNTITGNTCNSNVRYGIYLDQSRNNTFTGNTSNNNNYSGIYLDQSSNNTITGNTCIRGTGLATDYTTSQYTIWIDGLDNNYNLIAMNNCMGKAVTVEGGTGNTLVNNKYNET